MRVTGAPTPSLRSGTPRIASGSIRFDIRESYAAGDEVANVGTITTMFPDGSGVAVDGVFTYRVGDDGLIRALRAFWSEDSMRPVGI